MRKEMSEQCLGSSVCTTSGISLGQGDASKSKKIISVKLIWSFEVLGFLDNQALLATSEFFFNDTNESLQLITTIIFGYLL
jgi:hypothetical protein